MHNMIVKGEHNIVWYLISNLSTRTLLLSHIRASLPNFLKFSPCIRKFMMKQLTTKLNLIYGVFMGGQRKQLV